MKLTTAVKLLPSEGQTKALEETLRRVNAAANYVSGVAWDERCFSRYKLRVLTYYDVKGRFDLTAQFAGNVSRKVSDSYRLDKKTSRTFKPLGAIAYDDRILSWKSDSVSIWTTQGRQAVPFVCDERSRKMLANRRGESDLVYRDGMFFLLATIEVNEPPLGKPEGWIGVDLGIANIAATSIGEKYSGSGLKGLRHRYARIRSRLQARQTEAAHKLLKKRKRKEGRMARHVNHCISKRIVSTAKRTNSGIALENLKGIRERIRAKKPQRRTMHSWSFYQLREFITYKARLAGVAVVFVDPRNTSRTCPKCGLVDKRNRPKQDTFKCVSCSFVGEADSVAATNIARRATVNWPDLGCEATA